MKKFPKISLLDPSPHLHPWFEKTGNISVHYRSPVGSLPVVMAANMAIDHIICWIEDAHLST